MDNVAKILGESGLPKEMIDSLQEAFEKKVSEARADIELSLREEFAQRYEHDKANLVEAMDRMLSDVVNKTEKEKAEEVAKLKEARDNFATAVKEAREHYKAKLAEHISQSRKLIDAQLTKTIRSLNEEKKALKARKKKLDEQYQAVKADVAKATAQRLKKIDEFVVNQLSKELTEFRQDKRALVEARVKVVAEGRQKIAETRKKFIKDAARKVESVITSTLKHEMSQLHEDLERNRQNNFGRRIFEAVAAEFMASYFTEGSEIRKLQSILESKDKALSEAQAKLNEANEELNILQRKMRLAEERANRAKIMGELLSGLSREKRAVMESMLETTKTEHLRATFDKLLPVVLNETRRKHARERDVLNEAKSVRRTVPVTGDKTPAPFAQGLFEEDSEVAEVVRLAGIRK
jgi:hypothetical protein